MQTSRPNLTPFDLGLPKVTFSIGELFYDHKKQTALTDRHQFCEKGISEIGNTSTHNTQSFNIKGQPYDRDMDRD